MKTCEKLLSLNGHTAISKRALQGFGLLLSLSSMPAGAQNCFPEANGVLHHWIMTTPLPVLLLIAFGIALGLGMIAVSAYLLLVPEIGDNRQAGS